jgi:sec-independent protein translocase protein TatA
MGSILLFISGGELVLVMLVALLFFGSKAIPDIARTLGKGMREFKKATNEIKRELEESTSDIRKDLNEVNSTIRKESNDISKGINDNLKS